MRAQHGSEMEDRVSLGVAGGEEVPWRVRKLRPGHWVTFPHDLFSAVSLKASLI